MESFWNLICKERFGSGILFLPWTPIYGFGACLILVVFNLINNFSLPGWLNSIILAFVMMILLTVLEFIGGTLIEKVFHKTFWDYRPFKYNFGKYISLEISLIWAFSSVIFAYIIEPIIKPFILRIHPCITITFIILFILDNILTMTLGKVHK